MNLEMIVRTLQFILAPTVMINACAVLITGLLGHYAAINHRLRDMSRERLALAQPSVRPESSPGDSLALERLGEIDAQLPELLIRHRQIRDAVLFIYGGVSLFVASMLGIALGAWTGAAWASTAALVVFLMGMVLVLIGVLIVAREMRRSHLAIAFEVGRASRFGNLPLAGAPRAPSS